MGEWKLSKEEFERCKKEAVEKTVEKFFPDIEGKEKMGLCRFFEELFNEFMVSERKIYLEKEEKDKGKWVLQQGFDFKIWQVRIRGTKDKKWEIQPRIC